LCAWDGVVARRFSLTTDFASAQQALAQISHGNLDPYSTAQQTLRYPFWQGHAAIVAAWLLGALYALRPQATTILWAQVLATVGCEVVAFTWMRDLLQLRVGRGTLSSGRARGLLAVGLVLLLADPWIVWAVTVDFHWEAIDLFCVLVTLRQVWRGRRSAWVWAVLTIVSGNLGATYLIGAGLSCVLAGRRWWRSGAALLFLGVAATAVISVLHADQASGLLWYAYLLPGRGSAALRRASPFVVLAGVVDHLGRVARVLWAHRLNLLADVAAGGLVGLVWPWTFGIAAVGLLESGLAASAGFSLPGFQNLPELVLVPIGTVAVLAWLVSADRRYASRSVRDLTGALLAALLLGNVGGWAGIWLPRTASQWLRVDPAAAETLSALAERIPPRDEVIVSQGVAGGFGARRFVYAVQDPGPVPIRTRDVYVVLAPAEGIESLPETAAWSVAARLASTPRARLVVAENGVWAFDWHPGPHQQQLVFPAQSEVIPGWAVAGAAGRAVTSGPHRSWGTASTGAPGLLVDEDYWDEVPGLIEATFSYRSAGALQLQVWDVTSNVELASVVTAPSGRLVSTSIPVDLTASYQPAQVYDGWGPFSVDEVPPPPGAQIELRVDAPTGLPALVVSLGLLRR
jgi:hypothetical protein